MKTLQIPIPNLSSTEHFELHSKSGYKLWSLDPISLNQYFNQLLEIRSDSCRLDVPFLMAAGSDVVPDWLVNTAILSIDLMHCTNKEVLRLPLYFNFLSTPGVM